MRIYHDKNTSQLVSNDIKLHNYLDEHLAFHSPGYVFSSKFKSGLWDGYYHLYKKLSGKFASGLLNEVVRLIKSQTDEPIEIIDNRIRPAASKPIRKALIPDASFSALRDYQIQAVLNMIKAEHCIVKAATNAGKTEMFADVIRQLNLSTVILVNRKELMYQTAERLHRRLGVPVGMIGDGKSDIQKITVAMITSLTSKSNTANRYSSRLVVKPACVKLLKYDVLVLDECHNITDARIKWFVQTSKAYYRFAVSGTPLLNDELTNKQLIGQFGEVAFEITNTELIDQGVSSKPTYLFYDVGVQLQHISDYREAYDLGIVMSTYRNTIIKIAVDVMSHLHTLIIVKEIEHGHQLQHLIPNSTFIHGSKTSEVRMQTLKDFKVGKIKVLISSTILDEGADIPNIEFLVLAAGLKSAKRQLQRIGRGLRKKDSNKIIILDFLDSGNEYLMQHSLQRVKTVKKENFDVRLLKDLTHLKDI